VERGAEDQTKVGRARGKYEVRGTKYEGQSTEFLKGGGAEFGVDGDWVCGDNAALARQN
jgi:hypothetical protein